MDGKIDGGHTDDCDRLLLPPMLPMPTTTTEATLWCHIIIRGRRGEEGEGDKRVAVRSGEERGGRGSID